MQNLQIVIPWTESLLETFVSDCNFVDVMSSAAVAVFGEIINCIKTLYVQRRMQCVVYSVSTKISSQTSKI